MITIKINEIMSTWVSFRTDQSATSQAQGRPHSRRRTWNVCSYRERLGLGAWQQQELASGLVFGGQGHV
jgi:hypothetical protein